MNEDQCECYPRTGQYPTRDVIRQPSNIESQTTIVPINCCDGLGDFDIMQIIIGMDGIERIKNDKVSNISSTQYYCTVVLYIDDEISTLPTSNGPYQVITVGVLSNGVPYHVAICYPNSNPTLVFGSSNQITVNVKDYALSTALFGSYPGIMYRQNDGSFLILQNTTVDGSGAWESIRRFPSSYAPQAYCCKMAPGAGGSMYYAYPNWDNTNKNHFVFVTSSNTYKFGPIGPQAYCDFTFFDNGSWIFAYVNESNTLSYSINNGPILSIRSVAPSVPISLSKVSATQVLLFGSDGNTIYCVGIEENGNIFTASEIGSWCNYLKVVQGKTPIVILSNGSRLLISQNSLRDGTGFWTPPDEIDMMPGGQVDAVVFGENLFAVSGPQPDTNGSSASSLKTKFDRNMEYEDVTYYIDWTIRLF